MDNPFKTRKTETPRKRRFPMVRVGASSVLVALGIATVVKSVRGSKIQAS